MTRNFKVVITVMLALASVALAGPGSTYEAALGNSGWKVSGPSFYELNIQPTGEGVDRDGVRWVSVSISKNFYFGPDPLTGLFPAIELNFSQVDGFDLSDMATRVIIESEGVYNGTGSDWTDYHWTLYQHGIASFNKELTNPTTDMMENGWFLDAFSEFSWEDDAMFNIQQLNAWGGTVIDGGSFFPGTGSGNLVIDLDFDGVQLPGAAVFQFMQTPTPEPATISLLAIGGLLLVRGRRAA